MTEEMTETEIAQEIEDTREADESRRTLDELRKATGLDVEAARLRAGGLAPEEVAANIARANGNALAEPADPPSDEVRTAVVGDPVNPFEILALQRGAAAIRVHQREGMMAGYREAITTLDALSHAVIEEIHHADAIGAAAIPENAEEMIALVVGYFERGVAEFRSALEAQARLAIEDQGAVKGITATLQALQAALAPRGDDSKG